MNVQSFDALLGFIKLAHGDQLRRQREPYWEHPLRVALNIVENYPNQTDAIIIALIHDVVEDTELTLEDVKELLDLSPNQLKVLKLLTKNENETSKNNLNRIIESRNKDALIIKFFDAMDNSNFENFHDRVFTRKVLGKNWLLEEKRYLKIADRCLIEIKGL